MAQAVTEANGQLLIFDAADLGARRIHVGSEDVKVESQSGELLNLRAARGWLRRLSPEGWRDSVFPGSHEFVVRAAWITALASIIQLADVQWLTPLKRIYWNEDKLAQQRACLAIGIATPPMALATRIDDIPLDLGDWLVVKPHAAGHFQDATGANRVVHATEMHRTDERLELLSGAPFLVQRRITAHWHLRIVTVRKRSWVCRLELADLPLDWRADRRAHSSFEYVKEPVLGSQAVKLSAKLGLGYSSQDWVVDSAGRAFFLDLNPAGQWLFLPTPVADAVTSAIAGWLLGDG